MASPSSLSVSDFTEDICSQGLSFHIGKMGRAGGTDSVVSQAPFQL